jgi:hypothetical protein
MNWQILIVIAILALALLYVGRMFLRKTKSFTPKGGDCSNDCGCDTKAKVK